MFEQNFPEYIQGLVKHDVDGVKFFLNPENLAAVRALDELNTKLIALTEGHVSIHKVAYNVESPIRAGKSKPRTAGVEFIINGATSGYIKPDGFTAFEQQIKDHIKPELHEEAATLLASIQKNLKALQSKHDILFTMELEPQEDESVRVKNAKAWPVMHVVEEEYPADDAPEGTPSDFNNISVLGEGTTAQVRVAQDIYTGALRLEKIIAGENEEEVRALAQAEIEVLKRLGRFHGVSFRISETEKTNEVTGGVRKYKAYIMTDHAGQELFDYLQSGQMYEQAKDETEKVEIFLECAINILEEMCLFHDLGILHLDIKSENAARDKSGKISFIDFAFAARDLDQSKKAVLEILRGTEGLIDPKVLLEYAKNLDTKTGKSKVTYSQFTDIYALGLLLVEILPFASTKVTLKTNMAGDSQYVTYPVKGVNAGFLWQSSEHFHKEIFVDALKLINSCAKEPEDERYTARALLGKFKELHDNACRLKGKGRPAPTPSYTPRKERAETSKNAEKSAKEKVQTKQDEHAKTSHRKSFGTS